MYANDCMIIIKITIIMINNPYYQLVIMINIMIT